MKKICNCSFHATWGGNPNSFHENPIPSIRLESNHTHLVVKSLGLRVAVAFSPLLCSLASFAALGGNITSVQADAVSLQARVESRQLAGYTLHEMRSATGTTVREYESPGGTVFAVGWKGPFPPNLKQLLGSQFEEYQEAMKNLSGHAGHGPITIRLPNLVVQLAGHMGDYSGRAYIPDKVPAGTSLESIR